MSNSSAREKFLPLLRPIERDLEVYARRMLWDQGETRDAIQNAVLRAFKAFDRYHEDASFRGWMFRILTNEIFTLNRKHSRRAKFEFQLEPEELAALPGASLDGDAMASLSWPEALDDRLVAALHTLPEQERAVLLLRAIGGLAYDEMAAALEIPMGSVMGYLSRARQKMRATLARTELNRKTKP